jgi:hypothetical protein
MEITRENALERLNRWRRNRTTVGLYFAARGGTAGSTMLAQITDVGATIVFRNEGTVLRYGLYKARFEYGPLQVLLKPSREGMVSIDGLHIWLESGHWLFVCDGESIGQNWLESARLASEPMKPGWLLESQAEREFAFRKD